MRQKYLLKISFLLTLALLFYACTSKEERISSLNKEIQVLKDSMAVATKKALKPRLQKKNMLDDTLEVYRQPFERDIALLNDKILSAEKKFRKDLQIAKDQHFSRFGHQPSAQGSLNRIIDNLIYQKEKKVSGYQAEISRIEESYHNNPFYLETTKQILALETELQKEKRKINQRFKGKMNKLEDSLANLGLIR